MSKCISRGHRRMPDLKKAGPGGSNLLGALQMAKQLEAGATTSVSLIESCLARIKARDGDLHAWAHVDPEAALAQARARDREPRRSALHGIPVGIKDIFETHDMPTPYGSPIYSGFWTTVASRVVVVFRRGGIVFL